jgi:hypothetical protein
VYGRGWRIKQYPPPNPAKRPKMYGGKMSALILVRNNMAEGGFPSRLGNAPSRREAWYISKLTWATGIQETQRSLYWTRPPLTFAEPGGYRKDYRSKASWPASVRPSNVHKEACVRACKATRCPKAPAMICHSRVLGRLPCTSGFRDQLSRQPRQRQCILAFQAMMVAHCGGESCTYAVAARRSVAGWVVC